MAIDQRFYKIARRVSTEDLANFLGANLEGSAQVEIADFSQPQKSGPGILSYIDDAAQLVEARPTGIVITTADLAVS